MKKFVQSIALLTALMFADITVAPAQNIMGITMIPANPTNIDSIIFIVDCRFQAGNCDPYVINQTASGNYFYASALHCLGVATFICSYSDTIVIPPQIAGNYNFVFQLDAGYGPTCTPGIVAGPTDTLSFVVASSVGISENKTHRNYALIPNPSNGTITIQIDQLSNINMPVELEVFSLTGEKVANYWLNDIKNEIKTELASGLYLCRLMNNTILVKKLVIIN